MPQSYKKKHMANIINEKRSRRSQLKPGHIATFRYRGENVNTPKPLVLVLNSDYEGKLHGLNIEYISEKILRQLYDLVKEYSRLKSFLNNYLGKTSVVYRTYKTSNITGIKIMNYQFEDSTFAEGVE